jgi:hypothetical protein
MDDWLINLIGHDLFCSNKFVSQFEEMAEDEIINLNVGGKFFSTYKSILNQKLENGLTNEVEENYFNKIFKTESLKKLDENKRIFIDRDPTYFRFILNYLRNFGDVEKCIFPEEEIQKKELLKETQFYGLNYFTNYLSERNHLFVGSHILNSKLSVNLSSLFPNKKWNIIYRGSNDGFCPLYFHSFCDNLGPSVVLILTTNGYVFGGYTSSIF